MNRSHFRNFRSWALSGVAVAAIASPAWAQEARHFEIPEQSLIAALEAFGKQGQAEILFNKAAAQGRASGGVSGEYEPSQALSMLLAGSGLQYRQVNANTFIVEAAQDPQSGSAAGDGATVEALIVTAQKREEDIQDVPIAISAFTQEQLDRSQVAGGPDLMTQVPNMTFTKTNFSSYSIQLRGIGTQAISATVDPAVAVAFNNTPFIRNRFFEQEFYDLQRVEVLRGPQGTLYGRNATAGVVNLISNKAKLGVYEAMLSGDVANYNSTRVAGMINIPLAEDAAALRIAGAWTKRDGYAVNEVTGNPIDGRDLWSTRVSLRLAPTDSIDVNLIWEHFEEDDDRIRSGKQLCKTHEVTDVAGIPVTNFYQRIQDTGQGGRLQASLSQGCLPASLYSPESFQKTNSLALPYYAPLGAIHLPIRQVNVPGAGTVPADPYASRTQSTNLRVIEAAVDPSYRAKTDIVELQFSVDLTDTLTLDSETSWASDFIFSTQDYNRFAGAPHAWRDRLTPPLIDRWYERGLLNADGEFCDPQIGCSDRLVAMDLSTAQSSQFSQELRVASDFDGPFNFSLGANFLRYDTNDKYYVFINSITMLSAYLINGLGDPGTTPYIQNVTDNRDCLPNGIIPPDYSRVQPVAVCTYIDPNPVTSLNDLGHNYFLSQNPYKLISYAVFGESYYNITENLKVTAGLRWTVDQKEAPRIPSWIFAGNTAGHPIIDVVEQKWEEPTGRLAIDWKPDLAFTDETLLYASYAHGYKAGGMNPPPYGKTMYGDAANASLNEALARSSALHPTSFEPEFVDALELGAKNTLLDGALTLNLASFYYDYQGYQLSQIVNRSAVTLNFDTEVWGLELEGDWRPVENLRLGVKLGYEETKVGDGMRAIDVMDRTAGNEAWLVTKPFPTIPSNCVLPAWLFLGNDSSFAGNPDPVDVGGKGGGSPGGCEQAYLLGNDPALSRPYVFNPYAAPGLQPGEPFRTGVNYAAWSTDPADYPCLPAGANPATMTAYPGVDPQCLIAASNNGEGFYKDLSGNELPNAPNLTATLTADYTIPLPNDWLATLHTDLYYQSEAWTRIFNTEGYDKLKAYTNVNLAAIFTNEEAGWKVMAYVKNVFDRDSITGAFLNSDDSGLTTNIFLTEPRLYGLRVTKEFTGGPWWTGANPDHTGPFPLTVEIGGQIQRQDAPRENLSVGWFDALSPELTPEDVQGRDLDWGDGRSLKLTYRPGDTPWSISGSVRYGRTNNDLARSNVATNDVIEACGFDPDTFFGFYVCNPASPYFAYYTAFQQVLVTSWSDAEAKSREEHTVVDFAVGYDVGIGMGVDSTVSAGIRRATFESDTAWAANGQTNWNIPDGWNLQVPGYEVSMERQHARLTGHREFEGTGPVLTWDAAAKLWGDDEAGRLDLDWSVTAGALFGDRETVIAGDNTTQFHKSKLQQGVTALNEPSFVRVPPLAFGDPVVTPISITRSDDATVPVLDLSLGLSYDVGRIKVGAGYRWERYSDVLDVGFDEAKEADRTIDGPYFKLAVGFGG